MASTDDTPFPLISLGLEAVAVFTNERDLGKLKAAAFGFISPDAVARDLPSYAVAREVICDVPLVAERYGTKADVGDRLTLQFVNQLFPRSGPKAIRQDVRRLWRRFISELSLPTWRELGVANLLNFNVQPGLRVPLSLGEGVTIRRRSFNDLRSIGFGPKVWDLVFEDLEDNWFTHSDYVICFEYGRPKNPATFLGHGQESAILISRAVTCLRLAGRGDIMVGPAATCRFSKFRVTFDSTGMLEGPTPPDAAGTGSKYVLSPQLLRTVRTLQRALAHLDVAGYATGPGNLDLALRSFESTYDRSLRHQDSQLVDIVTAAEALLSPDTSELSFRLSYRVAGLLGRTPDERLRIFQKMRTFYSARSTIVHGSALSPKRRKDLQEILNSVEDAREIVRPLLVAFIRLAAAPKPMYPPTFFKGATLDAALWDDSARRRLIKDLGLSSN